MTNLVNIVWFRRDLRLHDNMALSNAIIDGKPIIPLFIFDDDIIDELHINDARISFIYKCLESMNSILSDHNGSLLVKKGSPLEIFECSLKKYEVEKVFYNKDYEPYALQRDNEINQFLDGKGIDFLGYKDHVIFEEDEVTKDNGEPYSVYTPYSKKWKAKLSDIDFAEAVCNLNEAIFLNHEVTFPSLEDIGFIQSDISVNDYTFNQITMYSETRDVPSKDSTSKLSTHLRFGTVSTRQMVKKAMSLNEDFLNELIWREFFIQIMWHYPNAATSNFRKKYDGIEWLNNPDDFEKWCEGRTGYPIVDAGMRELNQTGSMHNRVRMITASFLCKHLLIDWRWGEAYFAEKLLDFDLSINNGNWQWVAGTGCDAAPYFRVFNPASQRERFDPNMVYIQKWVPEVFTNSYPKPMVDHKMARQRALDTYKIGING